MPLLDCASARIQLSPFARPHSALRVEVEQYSRATDSARVAHFGRVYPGGSRYVCVTARGIRGGFVALYFFNHGRDDWRRYPPRGIGPSIAYWSNSVATVEIKAAPG